MTATVAVGNLVLSVANRPVLPLPARPAARASSLDCGNHEHRFKRIVEPAQTRQQAPRSRHEQVFLDRWLWRLVELARDQRPGIARPPGTGAEHYIGEETGPAQELAHTRGILAAAPRERAILVDQRGIVPARLGMTKKDHSAH
jgi:hypothetical protein